MPRVMRRSSRASSAQSFEKGHSDVWCNPTSAFWKQNFIRRLLLDVTNSKTTIQCILMNTLEVELCPSCTGKRQLRDSRQECDYRDIITWRLSSGWGVEKWIVKSVVIQWPVYIVLVWTVYRECESEWVSERVSPPLSPPVFTHNSLHDEYI